MPGGMGGKQTTQVKIPEWLDNAGQAAVQRGQQAAQIGYQPWMGPNVAALTPMQDAAFQGTNQAAAAFGMPTSQGSGMPPPATFAGGVQGYSSAPMFNAARSAWAQANPGQAAAYARMFANPQGAGPGAAPSAAAPAAGKGGKSDLGKSRKADSDNGRSRNRSFRDSR